MAHPTEPVHPITLGVHVSVPDDGPLTLVGTLNVHGDRDPHGNVQSRWSDVTDGLRELADALDAARDDYTDEDDARCRRSPTTKAGSRSTSG